MSTWRKISVAAILLSSIFFLQILLAGAAAQFSVSPGSFTVRNAPPLGKSWIIPEKIVVWNRDNVERVVFVTSEVPPENMVTSGYEPIPDENWVRPFPSSFSIEENSSKVVQISLDIPRWENLTGQRWEVWIPVERQPLPGEVGVLRPTVRMKIETTQELPPLSELPFPVYVFVGVAAGVVVVVALGLWYWSKRRVRKRWTLKRT